MSSKPKRMHPLVIVLRSLELAWIPVIKMVFRGENTLFEEMGIALFIWAMMILFVTLPRYFSTTYQLTEDALVVRRGILRRQVVQVNYARIQTVQHKQWFFMKPFDLVSMVVETAAHAGNEPEVRLDCVPAGLVRELEFRQAIWRDGTKSEAPVDTAAAKFTADTAMPLWHADFEGHDLMTYAITSLSFLPLLTIVLALWQLADSLEVTHGWFAAILHVALKQRGWQLVLVVAFALVLAMLCGIAVTVVRYWHYHAAFDGKHLRVTQGLLQSASASVETQRVQLLRFEQNGLRAMLRRGTATAILAAGGGDDSTDNISTLTLLPLTTRGGVWSQLRVLAPWLPVRMPKQEHFKTGTFALVRNAVLLSSIIVIGAFIWSRPLGYVCLLFIALGVAFGLFAGRTRALGIAGNVVYVSTGAWLSRTDSAFTASRVQSVEIKQSWFMTRSHLVHVIWHVREGNGDASVELRYVPERVGKMVYAWYLARV